MFDFLKAVMRTGNLHKASFNVFQSPEGMRRDITVPLRIRRHQRGEEELACTLDLVLI